MERFMNMASYRQVLFWDAKANSTGMVMKTSWNGLKALEYCAEKTGCHLEVMAYGGLPAKWRKYKGRQFLMAGLLFFIVGLYVLSSFVWMVDIEGNERLSKEELLSACDEWGLRPGAWKANVDTETITKQLLSSFADISWVSVSIQGTDATIQLAETIEKTEIIDKETPQDIVAEKDGVILQITAQRGTPLVQTGDVVKAGDVLISSEIQVGVEGEEMHSEYVAAQGSVTARTWQNMTEELPLQYTENVWQGEPKTNRIWIWKDKKLDIIKPNMMGDFETTIISQKPMGLGDFQLPIMLQTEQYQPYTTQPKTRTVEQAKKELEQICNEKAKQTLQQNETVEQIQMQYEVYTDCVRAICKATLSEEIGKTQRKGQDAIYESNGTDTTIRE